MEETEQLCSNKPSKMFSKRAQIISSKRNDNEMFKRNLHATFTSLSAYAEAARGRCVTRASSPKYSPLPSLEISISDPFCSILITTVPSSIKYMPSAASPETQEKNLRLHWKLFKKKFFLHKKLIRISPMQSFLRHP